MIEITDAAVWELQFPDIRSGDLLVDALFGTGLRTPLTGLYETIVADINASDLPVVSVDLPSGLSADTPDPIGPCIDATLTVTLGAPKLPLVLPPGEAHCGDVVIADIGIPEAAIEAVDGPHIELLTREPMRALIEPRPADSHKGDYGHVLIVAGVARQDRRRAPGLDGRAQVRRGAGHHRHATIVPGRGRGDGAGVHDRWRSTRSPTASRPTRWNSSSRIRPT